MHQEWTEVAKVVASFSLSEGETGWHSVDHPGACLDHATLSYWQGVV